jgi:hypothetical protein
VDGIATNGAVGTIIDTAARNEADDYWNKGTAGILRDAGGAGDAPEGEYSEISDFANSSSTVSVLHNFTEAVAAGDRYFLIEGYVPLAIIIQKINVALQNLGVVPWTDTTSLTTAADQTEYSLPIAAKQDLRQVWIQANKDTNANYWIELTGNKWYVEEEDPGNAATLVLNAQYDSGYALKLVYVTAHPSLYVYTDPLSEHVPVERVVYPAALECLRYRKQKSGGSRFDDDIARLELAVAQLPVTRPIRFPQKTARMGSLNNISGIRRYPGDVTKVYL